MKPKEKLVKKIIESLKNDYNDWDFSEIMAFNSKIRFRIHNSNIFKINLYSSDSFYIKFGIIDKIRIYNAIQECKVLKINELIK